MRLVVTLLISLLAATIAAHDYVPAKPQSQPILLKGGDLHTVSDGVMTSTDLLFVDGRIAQIGKNLTPDSSTKVIDVTGKNVYPGLIASNTALGLIEIGEVRATNDTREIGSDNPMVRASIAYNPDSELLPTVRSNGVTTALVVPKGRLITGYSFLVYLSIRERPVIPFGSYGRKDRQDRHPLGGNEDDIRRHQTGVYPGQRLSPDRAGCAVRPRL